VRTSLSNPDSIPAPFADRYANVARVDVGDGALLYLSGMLAIDDQGNVVGPGDIRAQASRIFDVIGALLAAHGGSFADVLHVRTYLTSLDDLAGYREVRQRIFPSAPPASTTVAVSGLVLPGTVVEIEVTAAVSGVPES
jgi:enamine deaminase RidA (YjgF/YER057c/UK114 family)